MICTNLIQIKKSGICAAVTLIDYVPGFSHAIFFYEASNNESSQNNLYDPYERREFLLAVSLNKIPFDLRSNKEKVKVIIGCIDHLEDVVEVLVEIFPRSKLTLCIPFKEAIRVVRGYSNAKTLTQRKYGIKLRS